MNNSARLLAIYMSCLVFYAPLVKSNTVDIVIRTAIEKPDCQSGMKSIHTIKVNLDTREVQDENYITGTTNILGCDFGSVNDNFKTFGHFQTEDRVKFTATGSTATIVTLGLGPSIDYQFTFDVNVKNKTVTFSGAHDGYPTYYVMINNSTKYQFNQTQISKLADPLDVTVNEKVVSF